MSAPIVLIFRLALALSLYAFLGWALYTLWRDVQRQGNLLAARKVPKISLALQAEGCAPTSRHFNQAEITFGRDPNCDIALEDETVSARHARLSYHHGQWWLEDLNSTNGTLLNRQPLLTPTVVITGDQIGCGKSTVSVNLSTEVSVSPTQRI
jgi:pSer/pThr/pTyr-binding forkhead associated (FHA) protein